jgi:hypothetical protein
MGALGWMNERFPLSLSLSLAAFCGDMTYIIMFTTYLLHIVLYCRPLLLRLYRTCVCMYVCLYVHIKAAPSKSFNGPRTYTLLASSSVPAHTKQVASTALDLRAFFFFAGRGFGA